MFKFPLKFNFTLTIINVQHEDFMTIRNGDIVVARIDDEVTLKYFQSSGDKIKLIPANDDFEEIYVNKETEGFFIEGKSVGLIREN